METYKQVSASWRGQQKARAAIAELTIDQALQRGIEAHKAGKIREADRFYTSILKVKPKHPDANHNIGILAVGVGKVETALPFLKTALEANPKIVQFWLSYIDALIKLDRLADAKALFDQAKSKGFNGDGFDQLKRTMNELGEQALVGRPTNKTLKLQNPQQEQLQFLISLYREGQLALVVEKAKVVTKQYPEDFNVWNLLGVSAAQIGQFDQAIFAFKKVLAIKPDNADAYYNIGNALKEQGKLEEALQAYNESLAIKPDNADAYYNMGNALHDQNELEKAIESYNQALAIKPDYAEVFNNMGNTLKDQGKPEEAMKAYNKVLTIKPDYAETLHNMSFILLNIGRLEEGLEKYESRWQNPLNVDKKRQFSRPIWDGKANLKGRKVLLWCEQGLGDTINWSSRLSYVSSEADRCILECQSKLVPLLTRSFPNIEIKSEDRSRDSQRDDFDFHLPMGSLYKQFIPQILKNPKPEAFLIPDPIRVKFWRQRLKSLGEGPYIGISWKSSNMSLKRLPNYADISEWSEILTLPNITFVNLQYANFSDDLTKIQNELGVIVHNFDDLDHYDDLDDVAALCRALDMVISTKITVPFISAGVGTVTKLANWRQSPWNNLLLNPSGPSIDIFERNTWEPWHEVFRAIANEISNFSTNADKPIGGFMK